FTETLSRVITSWGGTSRVTVRRSTFVIRSTKGMMKRSPGVFTFASETRPRRKMIPRSYSLMTLRPMKSRTTTTIAGMMYGTNFVRSCKARLLLSGDLHREPLDGDDPHGGAARDGLVRDSVPVLAVHEDAPAEAAHLAAR